MSDTQSVRAVNRSQLHVTEEVAIQITTMNKWFGTFHVLRDIDLTVQRGERIETVRQVRRHRCGMGEKSDAFALKRGTQRRLGEQAVYSKFHAALGASR